MLKCTITDMNGQEVASFQLNPKTFSTGSRGFGANQKVNLFGKKHQLGMNVVEVGSKPQSTT